MSVIDNSLLLTAPVAGGSGYQIQRSLRFNSADTAYLSRTPASAGNRKTWTWAGWVKRSAPQQNFNTLISTNNNNFTLRFEDNKINYYDYNGSSFNSALDTAAVYRDFSAWMHVVFAFDSTNATSSDRIRLYVNGSRITTFASSPTYPSLNTDSYCNNNVEHRIGGDAAFPARLLDGYLADVHFIDGQALDPSSFTTTDLTTGQLIPKAYIGSYGTNGFKLDFADNSSTAALGADTSGRGNNWTVNNFSVGFPITQHYSTTTTGTAPNPQSSDTYAQAFDGNTSTSFSWTAGTWAMNWTALPSPVVVSSSLRIYCYPRLGTLTVNINGSNVASITGNSVDWRTVSFTGTINTISFNGTDTYAGVYAIEVNGAILVDPRANSVNDSLTDTPTSYGTDTGVGGEVRGNYCCINANDKNNGASVDLKDGNLEYVVSSSSQHGCRRSTFALSSGKWYAECTVKVATGGTDRIGILSASQADYANSSNPHIGAFSQGYGYMSSGQKENSNSQQSYGTSYTTNDVIGIALDMDAGTLTFYKNGSSQGQAYSGLSGAFCFAGSPYNGGTHVWNFGQRAFAYTAPSGFKALCDTNLPVPTISKGNTVMDVLTYTGDGSNRSLSGLQFSPDFVWIKGRNSASSHLLYNSVVGPGPNAALHSDSTNAAGGQYMDNSTYGYLSAFDSAGFSLVPGSSPTYVNTNGNSYVSWCWDAGTSTVTNNSGSISSQVRANPSAGFSVVTYSSGNAPTVGHGLGIAPSLIITKSRTTAADWVVYHRSLGKDKLLVLNSASAEISLANYWGSSEPSSTVFGTIGNNTNSNNQGDMVAYCWAPVAGYSSFGTYQGNGSTNGPLVYTGFRPRWVLIKQSSASGENWRLFDTARNTFNPNDNRLMPNLSNADGVGVANELDIVSNGFKMRSTDNASNGSGATYLYACFAESPFQYARAR